MRKLLITALITILIAIGMYIGYIRNPNKQAINGPAMSIKFLNANFGNAIIIKTPQNGIFVIDPGLEISAANLISYLKSIGAESISIILSNPSNDRSGALEALVASFKVVNLLHGEMEGTSRTWRRGINSARSRYIPETVLASGDSIRLSRTIKLKVLNPKKGLPRWPSNNRDNNSLVLQISLHNTRFLLTSDIGLQAEASLIQSNTDLRNSVYVLSKHRKQNNASLELLSLIRPEICVISANNNDNPPSRAILDRIHVKNTGSTLYRTDKHGTINMVTNGYSILVDTEKVAK